jgi:D-glycero-alpha-D-manno-heptose-7-phosphate kinase
MLVADVGPGVEIVTMADVPSEGTGLGSSSALTVGLLNALYAFKGETHGASTLAKLACHIEIERLGRPIGKQDQYIAAYGGLRHIRFLPDETTECIQPKIPKSHLEMLRSRLLAFFTGGTRPSSAILEEQQARTEEHSDILAAMRNQTHTALALLSDGRLDDFGRLLHDAWIFKRQLASNISNKVIEEMYGTAREAGALGGKLAGAGGSGFLLLYVPPHSQERVRDAMAGRTELPIHFEPRGSRITFHTER